MTPAKAVNPAAAATAVPDKILHEGEVVILAVKPSPWFVLLTCWPGLLVAVLVAGATYLAVNYYNVAVEDVLPHQAIFLLCAAAALLQVFAASVQWVGRLYVLTNVRVMRIRGVFRVDLYQCPLKKIHNIILTNTIPERAMGVGSLFFESDVKSSEAGWMYVAKPNEVMEIVKDARSRAP